MASSSSRRTGQMAIAMQEQIKRRAEMAKRIDETNTKIKGLLSDSTKLAGKPGKEKRVSELEAARGCSRLKPPIGSCAPHASAHHDALSPQVSELEAQAADLQQRVAQQKELYDEVSLVNCL